MAAAKTVPVTDPRTSQPTGSVGVGRWGSTVYGDRVELSFLDLGGCVRWLVGPGNAQENTLALHRLTPAQARELAKMLLEKADECDRVSARGVAR